MSLSHPPPPTSLRVRVPRDQPVAADGDWVLYWMTAFRRCEWNFALERAIAWAQHLRKPLVVLEPLRAGYRWASDRLHQFVIEGMAANAARLQGRPVTYYPYLEPSPGEARGLLAEFARRACVVIGDDFPCFFLPRMLAAAAKQVPTRLELVDSNGLLPLRAAPKVFARAFDFRRFLQGNLRPHLDEFPAADPLANCRLPRLDSLPAEITRRWPAADPETLAAHPERLREFPIDHSVPIAPIRGGAIAAQRTLTDFLDHKLSRYADERSEPEQDVASGLSPHLHFGHISAHQVVAETLAREEWNVNDISGKVTGSSEGWWGCSPAAASFLDELVTWRELGHNFCWQRVDYDQYESLPDWAQATLAGHAGDRREHVYDLGQFERAETHDALWNAAQRQLLREGRMHNYLRMLWGKKILEWSASPRDALATMIELNNRHAIDGRDPNSYSGIFWTLGRYDRAWGPERPVFGVVRYMSSDNTARKFHVKGYLARYAAEPTRRQRSLDLPS